MATKAVLDVLIWTALFLCLRYRSGLAFHIVVDPSYANGLIHDDVSMMCRLDNSDGDVKDIMVLELSRNGVVIALLRAKNTPLAIAKGMESKFRGDGKISTSSSVYDSYINVTMSDPEVKDSGSYTCLMYFLNHAGGLQETKRSANLTVSDHDWKSSVIYLVDKVSTLEKELREREEENKKLQGSLENEIREREEENNKLQGTMEKEIREMKEENNKLQGSLENEIREMKEENKKLQGSLEKEIREMKEENNKLQGTMEKEIREMKEENNKLQGSLENELREMKEEEAKLRAQIDSLMNQDSLLKDKLTSHDLDRARQLQALQDKINQLIKVANKCPHDWKFFSAGDSCLKAYAQVMTFSDARQTCKNDGGDLVKVDSPAKHNFVQASFPDRDCWIGLWDEHRSEEWTYIDGSPLSYENWRSGEPNDKDGNEHCGEIEGSFGKWNDVPCEWSRVFVCEMPMPIMK